MNIGTIPCDMYVDISGDDCTLPMSKLAEAVNALEAAKVMLAVVAKSAMQADVPDCCHQMNLELVDQGETSDQYYFLIRKPAN